MSSICYPIRFTTQFYCWKFEYFKLRNNGAIGGPGKAAAMQPPQNPFFFLVQVSRYSYCHRKKLSDAFLLLFPCPTVILTITCECIYAVKMLLLCGDVELNPGPDDDVTNNLSGDLLNVVKAITAHVDSRHDELLKVLDEVKLSQEALEHTVSDINTRLVAVEVRVNALDHSSNTPS